MRMSREVNAMNDAQSGRSEHRLSGADHIAALLGGAVGGYLGSLCVALWLVPGVYSALGADGCFCCGFGVVSGYVPGIAASSVVGHWRPWVGTLVAVGFGTFFTAIVAAVVAYGAGC
jgi:hypothetical protein